MELGGLLGLLVRPPVSLSYDSLCKGQLVYGLQFPMGRRVNSWGILVVTHMDQGTSP